MTGNYVEDTIEDMWHSSGWKTIAYWHLSELKKAELQTLIIVRDIPGRELYLLDRITELQSELRKMEEGQ